MGLTRAFSRLPPIPTPSHKGSPGGGPGGASEDGRSPTAPQSLPAPGQPAEGVPHRLHLSPSPSAIYLPPRSTHRTRGPEAHRVSPPSAASASVFGPAQVLCLYSSATVLGVKGWGLRGNARSVVSIGPPSPRRLCWTARVLALEGIRPVKTSQWRRKMTLEPADSGKDAGSREDGPVNSAAPTTKLIT